MKMKLLTIKCLERPEELAELRRGDSLVISHFGEHGDIWTEPAVFFQKEGETDYIFLMKYHKCTDPCRLSISKNSIENLSRGIVQINDKYSMIRYTPGHGYEQAENLFNERLGERK